MQKSDDWALKTPFLPGLELSRRFYEEAVCPLLDEFFPNLPYAAALMGPGSEILGFDTELSMDHEWGARLFLVLKDEDAKLRGALSNLLSQRLAETFLGFPIHLPDPQDRLRTRFMMPVLEGPVQHRVIPITLRAFVGSQLGYDLNQPLQTVDWLTFPSHSLGEITAGAVHYDGVGELTTLRSRLAWYPHDVWLYLLASGWERIGEEEHLMPRAGFVGDELGSALIGSRLVRDVMNLCFLMEKQYAPYPKWFGTAFKRLRCAPDLWPVLWQAQQAPTWREREAALAQAYEYLVRMHNTLGIGQKLPATVTCFSTRPFQVIQGSQVAEALIAQISDPEVKQIAERGLIGSFNQWSDNTDMEGWERTKLRQVYE